MNQAVVNILKNLAVSGSIYVRNRQVAVTIYHKRFKVLAAKERPGTGAPKAPVTIQYQIGEPDGFFSRLTDHHQGAKTRG